MFQFSMTPGADHDEIIRDLEQQRANELHSLQYAQLPDWGQDQARSMVEFFDQAIAEAKRQAAASRGTSRRPPASGSMTPSFGLPSLPKLPSLPQTGLEPLLRELLK